NPSSWQWQQSYEPKVSNSRLSVPPPRELLLVLAGCADRVLAGTKSTWRNYVMKNLSRVILKAAMLAIAMHLWLGFKAPQVDQSDLRKQSRVTLAWNVGL